VEYYIEVVFSPETAMAALGRSEFILCDAEFADGVSWIISRIAGSFRDLQQVWFVGQGAENAHDATDWQLAIEGGDSTLQTIWVEDVRVGVNEFLDPNERGRRAAVVRKGGVVHGELSRCTHCVLVDPSVA
jgi:hypothetical protein